MLTNALGGSTGHVDVDVDLVRLEHGDRVLLCSDGLSDLVDDETIARTLAGSATFERRVREARSARARSWWARQRHGHCCRGTAFRTRAECIN